MNKDIKDYLHLYLGCTVRSVRMDLLFPMRTITEKTHELFESGQYQLILRPLSDMTEEEFAEFEKLLHYHPGNDDNRIYDMENEILTGCYPEVFAYCLKQGFDIFKLIKSGLAIDKTKGNVTKEEGEKPDCSQHKRDLFGETDMRKVAEAIGDLHYEVLSSLLNSLGDKFLDDSRRDLESGRHRLSSSLLQAGRELCSAHFYIEEAWQISKPFMKPNNLT